MCVCVGTGTKPRAFSVKAKYFTTELCVHMYVLILFEN